VLDINIRQKKRLAQKVSMNQTRGEKIAIFGFSYKKNTSDARSTPSVTIVSTLV
jgi:UDP-glucose 6-dehydrogenase